jgi:hypothetical protein
MKPSHQSHPDRGPVVLPYPSSLATRHEALHGEMVARLDESVVSRGRWLMFSLLAWEHLATCIGSYFLVEVLKLQYPDRWPYLVLWGGQLLAALATAKFVGSRLRGEESPLMPLLHRVWGIFLILSCNVVMLNVTAELPVFTFLPVLSTLSSFAFLVMASFLSRRFIIAALVMFVSGMLIARYPAEGFLIYGGAWWLVLQGLGVIYWVKTRRWLAGRLGRLKDQTHATDESNADWADDLPMGLPNHPAPATGRPTLVLRPNHVDQYFCSSP